MIRSFILSIIFHGLIGVLVLLMMLITPPGDVVKPVDNIRVSLYKPTSQKFTPEGAPPPKPVATPAPKPPEKKIEAPRAEPVVKKTEAPPKKTVKKDVEIVESTPTPVPTPKEVAKATPKPEPTPKPKPEKTPPPVDLSALDVPAPAPAIDTSMFETPSVSTDDGAVSTSNLELGESYANMVLYMIQQQFRPPYTMPNLQCVVSFQIQRDGTLSNWRILRSCGRGDLDQSAIRALTDTVKVAPLYDGYSKPHMDVEVTFQFEKKE